MSNLPKYPIYDPKAKIRNFRFQDDFENIRLNLSGTGGVYTDPSFLYFLQNDKEWRRPKEICSHPLFIDGKPSRFDALQGNTSDCWVIAAIESLTFHDELIKHVVPTNQNFDHDYIGAFHFRIWQLGVWYDVVVDDRLPVYKSNKKLYFARSKSGDVFWGALLEKAYAKVCGIGTSVTYDNLSNGNGLVSLQDLTGGIVEQVRLYKLPTNRGIKWFLNEVYSKRALLNCAFFKDKESKGLLKTHSYCINKVFKCSDDDPDYHGLFLIRIMNPWGTEEWKGAWSDDDYNMWRQIDRNIRRKLNVVKRKDGEFWMDEVDFVRYFEIMYVCHLGPGQYAESRDRKLNFNSWRCTSFSGEWVRNYSAGGSEIETRDQNPQYIILLTPPENDYNNDGRCTVVIQLAHRTKYSRRQLKKYLAFYVYSLTYTKNPPVPLNKQFIATNDAIGGKPDFMSSGGRTFSMTLDLIPGKYCIIPCTLIRNEESQFLLRVFSESRVDLWEYDTQISKSLPIEEQSTTESDESIKTLFIDVAQGQGEIDCIALRELLETARHPRRSFIGKLTLFLKFIFNVFSTNTSVELSNYYETDKVVFTKDECRSMIAMFDVNHSGKLNFNEFSNLWDKICFWTKVYDQHREETGGYITVGNLREAISSIGYNINKRIVHSLSYLYSNDEGNLSLKDFILCGIALETVIRLLQKELIKDENKIKFSLEEWVKKTLNV